MGFSAKTSRAVKDDHFTYFTLEELTMLSSLFPKPSLPGCNRLVGSYAVENDTVTLSQLAGAMVACPEPAMALERDCRVVTVDRRDFSVYRRNGRDLIPLIAPPARA